jgi:IclR family pca regulon transcriptional regulator
VTWMSTEKQKNAEESRLFVGSIAKCFQVLETLNKAGQPVGLLELAELSKLDRSSVQRITHTLRTLGYLKQDPANRAFGLSGRLLEFSHTILAYNRVREAANPHMERLSRRTGETVNLIELVGEDIVYVARFPSQHAVSVDIHIGSRLPAFCTAAGRAVLSRYSEDEIRVRIGVKQRKAWTEHTVTDTPSLLALISKARFDGYAVNDQETFIGDISIAAPLTDASGRPVAAVNIAAPVPRWTVEQAEKELAPHLLSTVAKINRELKAFE